MIKADLGGRSGRAGAPRACRSCPRRSCAPRPTSVRPGDTALVLGDGDDRGLRRRPLRAAVRAPARAARARDRRGGAAAASCPGDRRGRAMRGRRRRRSQPVPQRRRAGDLPRAAAADAAACVVVGDTPIARALDELGARAATTSWPRRRVEPGGRRRAGRRLARRRRGGRADRRARRRRPVRRPRRQPAARRRGARVARRRPTRARTGPHARRPGHRRPHARRRSRSRSSPRSSASARQRGTRAGAGDRRATAIDPDLRDEGRRARVDAARSTYDGARRSYFCCDGCRARASRRSCHAADRVAGLVLAAGGSSRLGQPKQLLPFGGATLLDHTLATAGRARSTSWSWPSAARGEVRARGRPHRRRGRRQRRLRHRLLVLDRRRDGRARPGHDVLVLLLGDQPGVTPGERARTLLAGRGDAPLAVCRYDDGRGHPFAFARDGVRGLATLHGDKGVWKLLDGRGTTSSTSPSRADPARHRHWEDYDAVLASRGPWSAPVAGRSNPVQQQLPTSQP